MGIVDSIHTSKRTLKLNMLRKLSNFFSRKKPVEEVVEEEPEVEEAPSHLIGALTFGSEDVDSDAEGDEKPEEDAESDPGSYATGSTMETSDDEVDVASPALEMALP